MNYRRRRRFILLAVMLITSYGFWKLLEPSRKKQPSASSLPIEHDTPPPPEILAEDKQEEITPPIGLSVELKPIQLEAKPEYKCRYKSSKFAPIDRSLISQRLQSIQKRYIRLHDAQQAMFGVEESARAPLTWGNNTARYLVWQGGNGNAYEKAKGYLGALMLAMLTDRVFVTDECETMAKYFCDPLKSEWQISPDTVNKLIANTTEPIANSKETISNGRKPIRALTLRKEALAEALSSPQLKFYWEHVQFIVIGPESQAEDLLALLKNEKSYETAWHTELFPPDGMALAPLYHSWMHPGNEVWDLHKAIVKEMATNKKVIVVFTTSPDDLKSLQKYVNSEERVFLYLTGTIEEIADGDLKALYPKALITTSWLYYPKKEESWGRIALDLQMVSMLDVSLLIPFGCSEASLLIGVNRKGTTLAYNKDGLLMPVAACDYYPNNPQ